MMFRKLYWVSEAVAEDGRSRVLGVYTSIPDLVAKGLRHDSQRLRLNLCKLDGAKDPLGVWDDEGFAGLAAYLAPFVESEEFSAEHVAMLDLALQERARSLAAAR